VTALEALQAACTVVLALNIGHPAQTLPAALQDDSGVTNIRNTNSSHWRRWLGVENRCVVPFTSFSENEVLPDGSRPPIWFALMKAARSPALPASGPAGPRSGR
jgi:putative SOS response-associated peptidase YedK